jgi:hypothetical protein
MSIGKVGLLYFLVSLSLATPTVGEPVTYTARAVMSGSLGPHSFSNALVVITMRGDTRDVQSTNGTYPSGVVACCELVNRGHRASISITQDDGSRLAANFLEGQIVARYDEIRGLVGFGSSVSPYYPITVGCYDPPNCSDLGEVNFFHGGLTDWAKFDGLATIIAAFDYYTDTFAGSLDTGLDGYETLSDDALLAGVTHYCAGPVDSQGSCMATVPAPLRTDHGDLYFSDLTGSGTVSGNVGIFLIETGRQ